MFSWIKDTAQSTLATVAGTAEPIYGAEALHSVAKQAAENPSHAVANEDIHWLVPDYTAAETQTWYLETDGGLYALVQVIYSNVANMHLTAQFNVKIFHADGHVTWSSKQLENYAFEEENRDFYADDIAVQVNDEHTMFTIKSAVDPEVLVDLKIKRTGDGFKIGKDGRTNFGTDPEQPWGFIRHVFWPKGTVEGGIRVKDETLDFTGKAMFVMAMQGMKPHHAASRWNFINFQSEHFAANMMEFTTPPSYGSQVVNVAGIIEDGKLLMASSDGMSEHLEHVVDDVDWPEPKAIKFAWKGKTADGKDVEATVEGPLGDHKDRVDFMAEVPGFIKSIVATAAGTRPFIYQYWTKLPMKVKIGDEVREEEGTVFAEATFIS